MLDPAKETWPPDYLSAFRERQRRLIELRKNPKLLEALITYYRESPNGIVEFIKDWGVLHEPREAGTGQPAIIPFIPFKRQLEFFQFIMSLLQDQESGLAEKSRDVGATWGCVWISIGLFLFWEGASIGWGSRKSDLVDKRGVPDSIFEKIRIGLRNVPRIFLPRGFSFKDHMLDKRIINPENNSTISGDIGDDIGRGGRSLIYFKDESAHYERPELIEAALMNNTNVQVDISSVHGLNNVFHRKREAGVEWYPGVKDLPKGKVRVFVFDWRDHPGKTQEWYDTLKQEKEDQGLQHVFAQEVDRDYAASVEGVIIPAQWVRAAIDAHIKLGFSDDGGWCAALDVADEGGDTNALSLRKGVVLRSVSEWGEGDTGKTARRAVDACKGLGDLFLQYDSIGPGAGIKGETNRLRTENLLPKGLRLVPWNAGSAVQDPEKRVIPWDRDSPMNKDFFANLKAQAAWSLRRRFEMTFRAVTEKGFTWKSEDLISIDSRIPLLRKIEKELSQPTIDRDSKMRLVVNKKPQGSKSPNICDSIIMNYFPAKSGILPITDEVLKRIRMSSGHPLMKRRI